MTKLKAMALVGVGTWLLFAAMAIPLVAMHAGGEVVTLAFAVSSAIGSLVMTWVLNRYEVVEQRRKREKLLLR